MKLAEVFMMDTCVVDVPLASAVVKRDHMTPLKVRLRAKNVCLDVRVRSDLYDRYVLRLGQRIQMQSLHQLDQAH